LREKGTRKNQTIARNNLKFERAKIKKMNNLKGPLSKLDLPGSGMFQKE
jgi:hypothetical protein